MFFLRVFVAFLFMSGIHTGLTAQTSIDTNDLKEEVILKKKGSIFSGKPGKSLLLSLALPGTGQIYNKSYLRVPFVYAAVGGMGYVLHYNTRHYTVLRDAYKANIDGQPYTPPGWYDEDDAVALAGITNPAQLRTLRDKANADRQSSIIFFSLVWLANGIDAFVDAHLKDFDMNEDISIQFRPTLDDDAVAPMRVGMFVTMK